MSFLSPAEPSRATGSICRRPGAARMFIRMSGLPSSASSYAVEISPHSRAAVVPGLSSPRNQRLAFSKMDSMFLAGLEALGRPSISSC